MRTKALSCALLSLTLGLICAMDGVVHERDFGPGTPGAVAKIDAYDPGPGWTRAK